MSERQPQSVNFDALLAQMEEDRQRFNKHRPTIVGGQCAEVKLLEWLGKLKLDDMPVRIWEFTDHCTIGPEGPPANAERLERARLFGEGGDLELRRNGNEFRWRYIGKADHAPKDDKAQALAWPDDADSPVYCSERRALLWGTREGEQKQWFEDRVSGAALTYLTDPPSLPDKMRERIWIKFLEYTQAGRTLAVWLLGLEAYQEVKND
jgi:hypothetical protein